MEEMTEEELKLCSDLIDAVVAKTKTQTQFIVTCPKCGAVHFIEQDGWDICKTCQIVVS